MSIKTRLKALLDDVLNDDVDINNRQADLAKAYDMDSMDAVDITDRVEKEFGVEVETKNIHSISTIGDLLDLIEANEAN